MLSMLIAFDNAGNVVATLDYLVARDDSGKAVGLVDFAAQEEQGELLDVWRVEGAKGSGTWPEHLGGRIHEFKVERANGRITALIHKTSGARRDRDAVEKAIAKGKPLGVGERGGPVKPEPARRPKLPIVGASEAAGQRRRQPPPE